MRDYYAVLGIAATAQPREIRQAYRRLARQYSPDVNFWDDHAERLFREIAEGRVPEILDVRNVDEFARRWAAYEVKPKARGAKQLRHPTLGRLTFDLEVLRFDDCVDRLLVTWLPADEATEAALRPRLRSVG